MVSRQAFDSTIRHSFCLVQEGGGGRGLSLATDLILGRTLE